MTIDCRPAELPSWHDFVRQEALGAFYNELQARSKAVSRKKHFAPQHVWRTGRSELQFQETAAPAR
jgi:hypothetical protein